MRSSEDEQTEGEEGSGYDEQAGIPVTSDRDEHRREENEDGDGLERDAGVGAGEQDLVHGGEGYGRTRRPIGAPGGKPFLLGRLDGVMYVISRRWALDGRDADRGPGGTGVQAALRGPWGQSR